MSTADPTATHPTAGARPTTRSAGQAWAAGLALFAGVLMIVLGVLGALAGIAALVGDTVYAEVGGYVYALDLTAWGWIHLILGVLVAAAGGGVITGKLWARMVGITLACLSLIANFLFLPYSPWWSLLIIALDVAVIWALSVYRPEAARG